MDALFTEDRSKVSATIYVPYMNSTAHQGKRYEKKKKGKRRNLKHSKRGSKLCLDVKKRYNRVYTLQISHLLTSYTQYMHHLDHDDIQEVQLMPLPNQKQCK